MKRRDFLKLLSVTPIAPGVLAAMPKKQLTMAMLLKCKDELDAKKVTDDFVYGWKDSPWTNVKWKASADEIKALERGDCRFSNPTLVWAKEMARLQNEAIDKTIIGCLA